MTAFNAGETSVLTLPDNGNGNLLVAQQVTLGQVATLTSLSFYVTTVGGKLRLGLYVNTSGSPGIKLAETAEFTPVAGWNTRPTLTQPVLQPGTYWLVYLPQSNALGFVKGSGPGSWYKTFSYGTLPAVFPAGLSSTTSHWSYYATFDGDPSPPPPPPPPPPAGAVTVTDAHGLSTTAQFDILINRILPVGVTLQAIDGELMTDATTMTNNYYARNSYAYAASTSFGAGKGHWYSGYSWDDPRFFPLGVFFGLYEDVPADFSLFQTMKFNVTVAMTGNSNATNVANAGVYYISSGNASTPGQAGLELDEPDTVAGIQSFFDESNATQDGRIMHVNFTHNQLANGDVGGTPMSTIMATDHWATPNSTHKSIGWVSDDIYFFAGSSSSDWWSAQGVGSVLNTTYSEAKAGRGSHYGQMIDVMRAWANGSGYDSLNEIPNLTSLAAATVPSFAYVENLDGKLGDAGRRDIVPPEMSWAVWSTLIHGARAVIYFVYITDHGGGEFSQSVQGGQTISIYDQAVADNDLIISLAPILNSPFALDYLTVSPHGYIFPKYQTNWLNDGIEACVHWYQNQFYIFATTRYAKTTTDISATFTIVDTGATTVTVVNEKRTIPITNGGTRFADTFANAWTVHIYRVD